jgi:hypothetical protein
LCAVDDVARLMELRHHDGMPRPFLGRVLHSRPQAGFRGGVAARVPMGRNASLDDLSAIRERADVGDHPDRALITKLAAQKFWPTAK